MNITNQEDSEQQPITIKIKPLSVNLAWRGQRFKTPLYGQYESAVLFMLPKIPNFPLPPYRIEYEFGFSNMASDFDNPVKLVTDILQKKYGFNDKDIMEAHIKKVIVPKKSEYFKFKIVSIKAQK